MPVGLAVHEPRGRERRDELWILNSRVRVRDRLLGEGGGDNYGKQFGFGFISWSR